LPLLLTAGSKSTFQSISTVTCAYTLMASRQIPFHLFRRHLSHDCLLR
jgi:hypothetical protein